MIRFNALAQQVLSPAQQELKPLLEEFMQTHFLAGGTAIALHLGHRRSIDFDLFTLKPQGTGKQLAERIARTGLLLDAQSDLPYLSSEEVPETTLFLRGVKVQLIHFNRNPFGVDITIPHHTLICEGILTPSLLDLAALKAFAMMYCKKWKDAVDLYFLLEHLPSLSFSTVIKRTQEIFGILYQEIATCETILENTWDTSEAVEYLIPSPPTDTVIQEHLIAEVKTYLQ